MDYHLARAETLLAVTLLCVSPCEIIHTWSFQHILVNCLLACRTINFLPGLFELDLVGTSVVPRAHHSYTFLVLVTTYSYKYKHLFPSNANDRQ